MPLLRIARGESVGILFGTPVCHKIHHAYAWHHYMTEQVLFAYGSPVTYYFCACYTNISFLRFSWLCAK